MAGGRGHRRQTGRRHGHERPSLWLGRWRESGRLVHRQSVARSSTDSLWPGRWQNQLRVCNDSLRPPAGGPTEAANGGCPAQAASPAGRGPVSAALVAAAGLPARRDGAGLVCGATRVASGSRGLGSWSAWYAARCKGVESRGGGQECRRRWKREKPQGAASRAVAEEICGCKQPFSAAAAALDRGCAVTEEQRRCTALRQSEHLALA